MFTTLFQSWNFQKASTFSTSRSQKPIIHLQILSVLWVLLSGIPTIAVAQPNVALYKPATQSSVYGAAAANRAVDGNTDGHAGNHSVSHTNRDQGAWLQIDLLGDYDITRIVLYNRTDCCRERLGNFTIYVNGQPFATESGRLDAAKTYYGNKRGRFVKIQLHGADFLSLAEVMVYGNKVSSVPLASIGYNVALGKPARQSSTQDGHIATRVNDGNTNTRADGGSINHTRSEIGAWWEVDLGAVYEVSEVVIYNRTDCCSDRLKNFYIKYSTTTMNHAGDGAVFYDEPNYPQHYGRYAANSPSGKVLARYIRVALKGQNYLHLAEVQVIGNLPGRIVDHNNSIYNEYWTYIKLNNPNNVKWETSVTNAVERSAGYQLDKTWAQENSVNVEVNTAISAGLPGLLDISTSFTVGTTISTSSSTSNSANQNKSVRSEQSDQIVIDPNSTIYFFTKWRERKARTVVAFDGKNWPFTATVNIEPAGSMAVLKYDFNDQVPQELLQYQEKQPIPDEVYQQILQQYAATQKNNNPDKKKNTNVANNNRPKNNNNNNPRNPNNRPTTNKKNTNPNPGTPKGNVAYQACGGLTDAQLRAVLLKAHFKAAEASNRKQSGRIAKCKQPGDLTWTNQAGQSWDLRPDFQNARLICNKRNNPYHGKPNSNAFKLIFKNKKLIGFRFMNEDYLVSR